MSKTKYKLRELGEYKNGANYPKGSYGAGDKIVNVKDLFRGRYVSYDGLDKLKSGALKNKNIYLVEDGDLLFTRSSLVKSGAGMVAMIKDPKEDVLFCGFIIRYRPNQSKVYPLYLLYLLRSPNYRKLFTDGSAQTNISNINQDTLGNIEVDLPSLDEQKKIVKIIDLCDAKIELNQRINAELEQVAKTLYDYWFVQFDFPNEKGKPYKSAGGKMVWNEALKREIPLGWEVAELSDIANITMGQSPPGESYNEDGKGMVFFQGCTDFGNRFPSVRQFTTQPTRYAKAGDILLSVRAPVGTINIVKEDCCIGRGLAALNSKGNSITYLLEVMRNLKQVFDRRNVNGTTFGSITKDDLFSLKVLKPEKKVLDEYQKIIYPTFEMQNKLELESQTLTELRDWLLPMLMNGQVSAL